MNIFFNKLSDEFVKFIEWFKTKGFLEPSLVFLFALVIRGLYLFEFYKNPFFDLIFSAFDQYCFDKAAGQIASGNIFGPFYSEKYSATYFYFLGVIYSIFGRNFIIIYGIQFLIGAISCVMLYAVSKKLFSRNIALIASLYGALYGPIIFHEGKLLRESIFIFLVIASFYSILRFCERNNYVSAFSAALFSSLAMQTRPNSIFLIPFIFYYLFASLSPSSKENRKGPLAAYFIFFLFISAPLLIRSYIINHRFIFYDDSGFITLALGNSPDYGGWGWGYTPLFQKFLDSGEQSLKGTLLHILNNFSSSPIKFLYLYLRKLFFVCNNWEIPSNVSYYIYRDFSLILSLPISNFSILFSLGITGMILNIRNYKKLRLLYFFSIGLFLSIIFVWINARFRLPLAPFLIIFSASAIAEIVKGIKLRQRMAYGYSLIILALLIFSNFPIGMDKIRPIDYGNTGLAYLENPRFKDLAIAEKYLEKAGSEKSLRYGSRDYYVEVNLFLLDFYQKQGRLDKVYEKYERTKRILPFDPKIEQTMGRLFFNRKDYPRAEIYYKKAIELNPKNFSYHNELGIIYGDSGNIEEAIAEFIKAININPSEPDAYYNLSRAYSFKGMLKEAEDALRKGEALKRGKQVSASESVSESEKS